MLDDIHEECGIAAVYVRKNGDAANKALFYLYKLLLNLQNRGQLSAGITTYNPNAANANWRNIDLGADSGAPVTNQAVDWGVSVRNPQIAGDALGNQVAIHVTADAEL